MDYSEPMNKVKDRMKQLQADNAQLKKKIEDIIKARPELIRSVEKTGFKLGMQEANSYTEKQTITKERETKEEELRDWQNMLQSNKDDLLKKKQELLLVVEDLKKTDATLNAEKEKLYEDFDKQRLEEEQKDKEETLKTKKTQKSLEELVASVKIEKIQGEFLTLSTLKQFYDALALSVSSTFVQLIDDYRKERREKQYNNVDFVQAFLAFEERTKTLMGTKQQEFIDKIKISTDLLGKSIQYHASKGNQEVLFLHSMLVNKLRGFKESDRQVTKEEALAFLKLKEKILREKATVLVDLMKEASKAQLIPDQIYSIMQFRVGDDIVREVPLEEEEITVAMKSLDNIVDPEIQELAVKVQNATKVVMELLVTEAEKLEKEQQQQQAPTNA